MLAGDMICGARVRHANAWPRRRCRAGESPVLRPDTVRILLTGQADMEDAVAAVNDGNIFRFLSNLAPAVLVKALTDAVDQHRMITAEKELLEQTLRGSVAALLETLSLANPMAFARADRIQRTVRQMVEATRPPDAWCIQLAAMLSQIGTVVLAPETLSKLNTGVPLNPEEQLQVRVLPWHAERLLAQIPRLEVVARSSSTRPSRTTATLDGPADGDGSARSRGECRYRGLRCSGWRWISRPSKRLAPNEAPPSASWDDVRAPTTRPCWARCLPPWRPAEKERTFCHSWPTSSGRA